MTTMEKPRVETIEPRLFAGGVADELVSLIGEVVGERGSCVLVLSGGSTPASIYRSLAMPPRVEEVDWSAVTLLLGDERWVPPTDMQSNAKMVHDTLLTSAETRKAKMIPLDTAAPTAAVGAERYEATIRNLGVPLDNGTPIFDIVLLGVGEDGHTASLFPGSPLVDARDGIVRATMDPSGERERVTLLPRALFSARHILFLVKGEEKAGVVKRAIEGDEPPSAVPSRLWTLAPDRVTWFLDSGAAKQLAPHRA